MQCAPSYRVFNFRKSGSRTFPGQPTCGAVLDAQHDVVLAVPVCALAKRRYGLASADAPGDDVAPDPAAG